MKKRTKIVCTIGPSVNSIEKIKSLIAAGMNVARLNFSHGTHQEHAQSVNLLKTVRDDLGVPLAIMLDTKGPEIRLGKLKNNLLNLKEGDSFWFVKEEIEGDSFAITLRPSSVIDNLKEGMQILLDDGYITAHVSSVQSSRVQITIDHGGTIRSDKSVNIPGFDIQLPLLTEKDVEDIHFACQWDLDLIAASFVRNAEQVNAIKALVAKEGKADIAIIAKIENQEGIRHIDAILDAADGIMIARGDLGVELPLTEVPRLQKMLIRKCYRAAKPSITATQMLESMIIHPRPTRAEASDVANAIYDSTDGVMLSAETAIGAFPIESVQIMNAIIQETERDFDYQEFLKQNSRILADVPSSVALASIKTAYNTGATAILAFTTTGRTVRLLSRFRPHIPIIALTPNVKVYHQMALAWGVTPLLCSDSKTIEDAYEKVSTFAIERGYVKEGDRIVIAAGTPFGRPGTTNMMIVGTVTK